MRSISDEVAFAFVADTLAELKTTRQLGSAKIAASVHALLSSVAPRTTIVSRIHNLLEDVTWFLRLGRLETEQNGQHKGCGKPRFCNRSAV